MSHNKDILNVFKARNNLLNILETRKFNVSDYQGFSVNDIHTLILNNTLDLYLENLDKSKKCFVKFYNLEKSIRPTNIYDLIDQVFNIENILTKNDDLIIIVKDEPNDSLQNSLKQIYEHDGIFISLINIERLQFNILNHVLVPKMRVFDENEKIEFKKKNGIKDDSEMPTVSRFDPTSIVLGLRPSQIVELERPSRTSIKSKFYRICSH